MEGVGLRAIAVGFREGIHVAFDGGKSRFALAWKGRFMDAESTWSDRFSPLAAPLGEDVWRFPAGPALARLRSMEDEWPEGGGAAPRFEGYRLDSDRVPVFRYSWDGVDVEDSIRPLADGSGWRRSMVLRGEGSQVFFMAGRGKVVERKGNNTFEIDKQVVVRVFSETGEAPVVRKSGNAWELLQPVSLSAEAVRIDEEVRW